MIQLAAPPPWRSIAASIGVVRLVGWRRQITGSAGRQAAGCPARLAQDRSSGRPGNTKM